MIRFLFSSFVGVIFLVPISINECIGGEASDRPNILIVTVDDMNCDSVGVFGCKLEGTTPHIDQLAREGLRYEHAHVQVGNCFPSRNVMHSGLYPHNTGVEGFYQVREPDYPHLVDLMKEAGYFVAIRGKVSHSTPYQPYAWDSDLTILDGQKQDMKSASTYYESTKRGIELAAQSQKPFCLNVNISDPHKPFYAMGRKGEVVEDDNVPSRIYSSDEVPVPGFLFDDPDVRRELAHYYSSVRRADDCFGQVIKALDESGQRENTVVIFLSDHGMPFPFAKTSLWNHSTRTPWIVHWPGVTEPNTIDSKHMISAVDLLPTVLEITGIDVPEKMDGRSFLATIRGHRQPGREMVYKVYNENSGGNRSPMRSVQSKRFGYLFNPWSDGKRVFKTATTGTMTYRRMKALAPSNPVLASRLELFEHGVPEEFYDYENDPDALVNLIDNPAYAEPLAQHRLAMKKFMTESGDPLLAVFERRDDSEFVSDYVDRVQAESDARRARRSNGRSRNSGKQRTQDPNLFQMRVPGTAAKGESFVVTIDHRLPKSIGEQIFHVTIKDASGKRIERLTEKAAGKGSLKVEFRLPESIDSKSISVAAFIGSDFRNSVSYRTQGPVQVLE